MSEDLKKPEFMLNGKQVDSYSLVEYFLRMPLAGTDELFSLFSTLPNAVQGIGEKSKQRYVYIPGTRADRLLLVAHADTVWDTNYKKNENADAGIIFEDGVFRGSNPEVGIGADDRAGCAMLWALRECGHSLLLLDGEEKGKIGARYLQKSNPNLFRELNRHRFMIELDTRGVDFCLFNQVDYTENFKKYILENLGVKEDTQNKGGCDLQILCHKICGVNIAVGYHKQHSPAEYLRLCEWERTYGMIGEFLKKTHPKFTVSKKKRAVKNIRKILKLPVRIINKLFRKK